MVCMYKKLSELGNEVHRVLYDSDAIKKIGSGFKRPELRRVRVLYMQSCIKAGKKRIQKQNPLKRHWISR